MTCGSALLHLWRPVRRDASALIEALLGLEDNFWNVERDENNIRHISSRATGHDKTRAWYEALVLPLRRQVL